jgi:hypothetical protein
VRFGDPVDVFTGKSSAPLSDDVAQRPATGLLADRRLGVLTNEEGGSRPSSD